MRINTPSPTATLELAELITAVQEFLAQRSQLPAGYRIGNLAAVKTNEIAAVGSLRTWLAGSFTFELIPESK